LNLIETTALQNAISLSSAGAGAFLAATLGVTHRQLCALISFAAGTLLATTLLRIVPEASTQLPLIAISLALTSGYVLFYLISRFLFHVCPACAASHFDEQTSSRFQSIAFVLLIAFGIHCVMDGIAIALGRELAAKVDRSIFLTITIHKFPEGLALCALLMRSGFQRLQSLFATLGMEALTLVGWITGLFLLKGFEMGAWFYLTLVHVGGSFIYLALHAVLNESKEHSPRYIVFFFLTGMAAIALTDLIPVH
jgi:zinc and cadmium transporter